MNTKGCYLIRDKSTQQILIEYVTPLGRKKKCIFRHESDAKGVLNSFIKTHWLLKNFDWEIFKAGEDWKSPNYQKETL